MNQTKHISDNYSVHQGVIYIYIYGPDTYYLKKLNKTQRSQILIMNTEVQQLTLGL